MSINPLQDACDQLAAACATVEGIRRASGTPPEQISEFPFIDVYIASGIWSARPGGMVTGNMVANIDVHLARKDQPREAELLNRLNLGVAIALFLALKNATLPAISTINDVPVVLSVFPGGAGQGTDTIGYRFAANIKIQAVIQ